MEIGSPFTIEDITLVKDLSLPPEQRNPLRVRTYGEVMWLVIKAVKRMDPPRVYISEPPLFKDRHSTMMWLISFDRVVTDLANKQVSVIDPTFIRSIFRDIPLHFKETKDILNLPDPLLQELINERLVDVIYTPQHGAHEQRAKIIRDMIKISQNRGQVIDDSNGYVEEDPPHYIYTQPYPAVSLSDITRQAGRRPPR